MWAFPASLNLTAFDLRRSSDPTFPTGNATAALDAVPVSQLRNVTDPPGVYGTLDPLVAQAPGTTLYWYMIRGVSATGAVSAWSAPFFTVSATTPGTLFASPTGASSAPCGTFSVPCGNVQDALDAAQTGAKVFLLHGSYAGARNCGLTMAGKVRFRCGFECVVAHARDSDPSRACFLPSP